MGELSETAMLTSYLNPTTSVNPQLTPSPLTVRAVPLTLTAAMPTLCHWLLPTQMPKLLPSGSGVST